MTLLQRTEEVPMWREGAEKAVRAKWRLRSVPENYSSGGTVRLVVGTPLLSKNYRKWMGTVKRQEAGRPVRKLRQVRNDQGPK